MRHWIATALLSLSVLAPLAEAQVNTLSINTFTRNVDGSISVVYTFNGNGGFGVNFPDEAALLEYLGALSTPDADRLLREALAYWRARDADLSNFNLMNGKTLTEDWGAANPIRVQ
jgi:hypothetical protein